MCYYHRNEHRCGHFTWEDKAERECEAKIQSRSKGDESSCPTVRLYSYRSRRSNCSEQCTENPVPKTDRLVTRTPSSPWSWRQYPCFAQGCILEYAHEGQHQKPDRKRCKVAGCIFKFGHDGAHEIYEHKPCTTEGCIWSAGHEADYPHSVTKPDVSVSRVTRLTTLLKLVVLCAMGPYFNVGSNDVQPPMDFKAEVENQLALLLKTVLNNSFGAWGTSSRFSPNAFTLYAPTYTTLPWPSWTKMMQAKQQFELTSRSSRILARSRAKKTNSSPAYQKLNLKRQQIRLFELLPSADGYGIQGRFHYVDLSKRLKYIALSYTWGSTTKLREIKLKEGIKISCGHNLWSFLRQQSSMLRSGKLFWIDAICIDQSNVHERNHQVNLMRDIYTNASEVYVWLGDEGEQSNLAMKYISKKASTSLTRRGEGYAPVWTKSEGKALAALCQRPYWKRMWIVQEIIHANAIRVWCGTQSFYWRDLEALYLKLKILEDTDWISFHRNALAVLQSPACTMVWQRAYWRHPQTQAPPLQDLIEIFQEWKCTDVRDKVFALVGMADPETAINPDYNLPARGVYHEVAKKHPGAKLQFFNLLSQILGLAGGDVNFYGQELIEYKIQPSEVLVLKYRSELPSGSLELNTSFCFGNGYTQMRSSELLSCPILSSERLFR